MKKILICVDVQEGFARHDNTKAMSQKIADMTHKGYFDYIIATQFINRNKAFTNIINWNHLKTSDEINFVSGLMFNDIEMKYRYTCVDSKFINKLKTINDGVIPEEVYICGIDTDCCVYKIAVDLFERNIKPIVITDYCDSNGGEESHKAGLTVLRRNIGIKQLVTLNDVINK